jgi:hypothetical protein
MPFPHIQGAFREQLVAEASQGVDATRLTPGEAAMAEPLAITQHATRRAGDILGKRVLCPPSAPIEQLSLTAWRRVCGSSLPQLELKMMKKPVTAKAPAEQVVKDIRHATRKLHSSEEMIRIVLSGLRGEDSIAKRCWMVRDRYRPALQPSGRHWRCSRMAS